MRLMLGYSGEPSLLVEVDNDFHRDNFHFYVINGCWYGVFTDGRVSVHEAPSGSWTDLRKVEILCDDQDRLRGDYGDVFENFDDVNYKGPIHHTPNDFDFDDDVPF